MLSFIQEKVNNNSNSSKFLKLEKKEMKNLELDNKFLTNNLLKIDLSPLLDHKILLKYKIHKQLESMIKMKQQKHNKKRNTH